MTDRPTCWVLTIEGEDPAWVTKQEWVDAERAAGFSGSGSYTEPSTWSWGGFLPDGRRVRGLRGDCK